MLPIPELMPFRLTRQMAGVLAPHDALAVLAGPMAAAFAALRSGADVLEVRCCSPFEVTSLHRLCDCLEASAVPLKLGMASQRLHVCTHVDWSAVRYSAAALHHAGVLWKFTSAGHLGGLKAC